MKTKKQQWRPGFELQRRILALASVLAIMLCVHTAYAVPVTYSEIVQGVNGGLGNNTISNGIVIFTFTGDTDNIYSYNVPGATGYVNAIGTATLSVLESTGNLLYETTFAPDSLYVSVDNTNYGIGFGTYESNGAYDPVYPYAMLANNVAGITSYDLASDLSFSYSAISCSGLETGSCQNKAPNIVPIATNMGDFYVYSEGMKGAYFSAKISTVDVPEPGSLALLPLGLIILGVVGRKHRQQRSA